MDQPNRKALEHYLLEHIPITAALGIKVSFVSSEKIVLSAPFDKNINHKQTVFGGSLHAVATLACWGWLHLNLKERVQIVIAHSEVDYLSPVNTDFEAECHRPDAIEWERFMTIFRRKGKARLTLKAKVVQDGRLCVDYTGTFVALKYSE
jgi:thioesterase domain-containing protein